MGNRRERIGIIITILTALGFGLYPAATRGVYIDGANPVFIILLTTFFRTTSLAFFCFATKRRLFQSRQNIKSAVFNGFFQSVSAVGILFALVFLPAPIVITIMFSYTILLYVFLVLNGEEKPNLQVAAAMLAAFTGLGLVVGIQEEGFHALSWTGIGLSLMAAVAIASRVYRYGQLVKKFDPAIVGAETFIFVLIFCSFLIFYQMPVMPTSFNGWMWALLASLSLAFANFAMFYAMSMLGTFKFAFFIKLEPVFGAIFAYFFIGEALELSQYAGMGLVVGSLCVYQLLQTRKVTIAELPPD